MTGAACSASHFESSAMDRASHPITHPSGNLPCSTVRDPEEVQRSKDETKKEPARAPTEGKNFPAEKK